MKLGSQKKHILAAAGDAGDAGEHSITTDVRDARLRQPYRFLRFGGIDAHVGEAGVM